MNKTQTETKWNQENPLLLKGEFAIVDVGNDRMRVKIGNGYEHFNDLPYFEETAGAYQGYASVSTLPNTSSGKVWYFATQGTYTNFLDANSNAIVVSAELAILSHDNGVWYKLDVFNSAAQAAAPTRLIVKGNGTIGVDCDFLTITAAMNSITDNSKNKPYIIEVLPFEYEEAGSSGKGLESKNYVDIIGSRRQTTDRIVIKSKEGATSNDEPNYYALLAQGNSTYKNITFVGFKCSDTVKFQDQGDFFAKTTFENCDFVSFGGQGSIDSYNDVGVYPYGSQEINFINCRMINGGAYVQNQDNTALRSNNYGFKVKFQGCNIGNLTTKDYLQYSLDSIALHGCNIETFHIDVDGTTVWGANVGNPLANRGFYPPLIRLEVDSTKIGVVVYYNDFFQVNNNLPLHIIGYNRFAKNASGSPFVDNQPVTKNTDIVLPHAYTSGDQLAATEQYDQFLVATDQLQGFCEKQILAGAHGFIREIHPHSIILANFHHNGNDVSQGDALQWSVANAGEVTKKTTGEIIGYAYEGGIADGTIRYKPKFL